MRPADSAAGLPYLRYTKLKLRTVPLTMQGSIKSCQNKPQMPSHNGKSAPTIMKHLIKSALSKCGVEITRSQPPTLEKLVVSLHPKGPTKGNVLLSDDVAPFLPKNSELLLKANDYFTFLLGKNNDPVLNSHGAYWHCAQAATTFLDLGYSVDVIQYNNKCFVPQKSYSFFTGYGNFERISKLLGENCVKIHYMNFNHWSFHNTAQYERLLALKRRKQIILEPYRLRIPDLAIEHADYGIIVGNEFPASTYSYAKKPIFRVPVSTIAIYDWPNDKNFDECRNHFLWLGGAGLLHKGLDLVLEAFSELPDCHLTVCGPIQAERDFSTLYHKELFETVNIRTVGWIDVTSSEFITIANSCVGVISASCSECGAGSVITSMHAGMIPVVNYESSVETGDFGIFLKNCDVHTIKETIKMVAGLPKEELKLRARKTWEYVRANHTRGKFAVEYRNAIEKIIALENLKYDGELQSANVKSS